MCYLPALNSTHTLIVDTHEMFKCCYVINCEWKAFKLKLKIPEYYR